MIDKEGKAEKVEEEPPKEEKEEKKTENCGGNSKVSNFGTLSSKVEKITKW